MLTLKYEVRPADILALTTAVNRDYFRRRGFWKLALACFWLTLSMLLLFGVLDLVFDYEGTIARLHAEWRG